MNPHLEAVKLALGDDEPVRGHLDRLHGWLSGNAARTKSFMAGVADAGLAAAGKPPSPIPTDPEHELARKVGFFIGSAISPATSGRFS